MKSRFLLWLALLFFPNMLWAEVPAENSAEAPSLEQRVEEDLRWVSIYRTGLGSTIAFLKSNPQLFSVEKLSKPRLLSRSAKEQIWNTWKSFVDYTVALDAIGEAHKTFWKHSDKASRGRSSLVVYAAFLTQYRHALDFIQLIERDPALDTILNEPVPEINLPKNTYMEFKFRFLHAKIATEFAMLRALYEFYPEQGYSETRERVAEDVKAIFDAGKGPGVVLTAKNAFDLVKKGGFTAWLPVQTGVSEWMGDTKVWRRAKSLISAEQIERMKKQLKPGDVLLERREWYLSNVGLPGFWPHTALFVGTAAERAVYFDTDEEVRSWVKSEGEESGSFNALLNQRYPEAYRASLQALEHDNQARVIEAISEGVSFTSLEHSADADSVAVLRPKLSKLEKAVAIKRAFHYSGRPYDFNFDFLTDATLVCSELVFRAYEPAPGYMGIKFPFVRIAGREVTTANELVRQFDETTGGQQEQFSFVLFLDGLERKKQAVYRPAIDFRKSWRRPKWHIFLQGTMLDQ